MRRRIASLAIAGALLSPTPGSAEVPVQSTVRKLSSSNGFGAILVDLDARKVTHLREHLFAFEEPLLDGAGAEVWIGNQPQAVATRDVLYDAYLGLRSGGTQRWLPSVPVDLAKSGYEPGTGVARMVQKVGSLEIEQRIFAPWGLSRPALVVVAKVTNTGTSPEDATLFSLHNVHLGYGRPGVMQDVGENGETVGYDPAGQTFSERGFAGVVVARALSAPTHRTMWRNGSPASVNGFGIVDGGGTADFPDVSGEDPVGDGAASSFQWSLGTIAPGASASAGFVLAHAGDPFAASALSSEVSTWHAGRAPEAVVSDELAGWSAFQASLTVPPTTKEREAVARSGAVVLRMAQVREGSAFLREHLTKDGEVRKTRFPATLPGVVAHKGKGAVLASLPPGEWTIAWSRDSAYAAAAMAQLGMKAEAKGVLEFFLGAEAGRFQTWNELKPYALPPYQISLTRYHGFGVEETDFNDFGPNLELDGFGLFLWALRRYEVASGDTAFTDARWADVSKKVADVIVAAVDPATGLLRKDSSIWEWHWNGRERTTTYTTITAIRGLCDAAEMAKRNGDGARASTYQSTAVGLRTALLQKLRGPSGALGSTLEEVSSGGGFLDAAVLDAFAMGVLDPAGPTAKATFAAFDAGLATPAGAGYSRNDDLVDHAGKTDLSPWGSPYDSAEWVFVDMRAAKAAGLAGDTARKDKLLSWVEKQTNANMGLSAETFDENTGTYKFNYPMVGFGAGAFALALAEGDVDAACGSFPLEPGVGGAGGSGGASGSSGAGGGTSGGSGAGGAGTGGAGTAGTGAAGSPSGAGGVAAGAGGSASSGKGGSSGKAGGSGASSAEEEPETGGPSCACEVEGRGSAPLGALLVVGAAVALARRRRQ